MQLHPMGMTGNQASSCINQNQCYDLKIIFCGFSLPLSAYMNTQYLFPPSIQHHPYTSPPNPRRVEVQIKKNIWGSSKNRIVGEEVYVQQFVSSHESYYSVI